MNQMGDRKLNQYFTPEWAAIEIVENFFPNLSEQDLVIEPSCGQGAFLKAIPSHVPAIGIEIDKGLAIEASHYSGRPVLNEDFISVQLSQEPSVIIGNPPFNIQIIEAFLKKSQQILLPHGKCGFILPSYSCQTPNRVLRWNEDWSLKQTMLPRELFPNAILPLIFLIFTKDKLKRMFGFALYHECCDVNKMRSGRIWLIRNKSKHSCWRSLIQWSLQELGGEASLRDIYELIEPRRISTNRWWKAKVRQEVQRHCSRVAPSTWKLN